MTVGIYKLTFDTGHFYVGRSICIEKRYISHCNTLRNNSHHSTKVQERYNCTLIVPKLEILDICAETILSDREVYWINSLKAFLGLGLNTASVVANVPIEFKYGNNSKYSEETYLNILIELAYTEKSIKQIAEYLNVCASTVKSVRYFYAHKWLKSQYPKICEDMLLNREKPIKFVVHDTFGVFPVKFGKGQDFARKYGLDIGKFNNILSGHSKEYNGWSLV